MIRNIIIIGVTLLSLMLAACSSDDELAVNTNHDITVSFTMSMGSPQQVTRAATDSDWVKYDSIPGNNFENTVDLNTLQVCLYDSAGAYFSHLEHITLTRNQTDTTKYEVVGVMRVDTLNLLPGYRFKGKMVVYANTSNTATLYGDSLKSDAVRDISYSYDPTSVSSIPMFGVLAINNADFTPGRRENLGDVWLLRAMAKVNVVLTKSMTDLGYSLDSVFINKHNTAGYVLPAGYLSVDNTRLLNYDSGSALSFHPDTVNASVSTQRVEFANKTLYLPEYDNSSNDLTLTVVISNKTEGFTRKATFDFAPYSDGNRGAGNMNVVRNHAYVFNVYGNPLKIDLEVQPWTKFTHEEIIM